MYSIYLSSKKGVFFNPILILYFILEKILQHELSHSFSQCPEINGIRPTLQMMKLKFREVLRPTQAYIVSISRAGGQAEDVLPGNSAACYTGLMLRSPGPQMKLYWSLIFTLPKIIQLSSVFCNNINSSIFLRAILLF